MASTIMPLAPLPERGFISAVGSAPTKSLLPPMASTACRMPSISMSMAPDALNTPMPTSMATR